MTSKIIRAVQKIFASASSDVITYGSDAASDIVHTLDVKVIQSLPAWLSGWRGALINYIASMQNQNAVNYVTTSQLAYLFQEGVPEYDADTTYYINSIVKKSGTTQLYKSITNDNIGNALTDTGNWAAGADIGTGTTTIIPFPDYTNGVSKDLNTVYQADTNGWIDISGGAVGSYSVQLIVGTTNNPTLNIGGMTAVESYITMMYPIPIGIYYKVSSGLSATWYPCLTS